MQRNETNGGKNVLDQILRDARNLLAQGQKPRFVFDLDSTIFCVSPRTEFILRQFGEERHVMDNHPETSEKLKYIVSEPTDWGIRTMLTRHEIKETLDFFSAAREYWIQNFFSSHHLDKDTPYKGAVEFVRYVHDLEIDVYYLTGRDRVRMEAGTIKSLAQHGLPLADASRLNMKPDTSYEDTAYKLSVFDSWRDLDQNSIWFFENEPVIINQVRSQFPEMNVVLMNSVHSGRESAPEDIPQIRFEWNFTKE